MTHSYIFSITPDKLFTCTECHERLLDKTATFSINENGCSVNWICEYCDKLVDKILIQKLVD